MSEAFLNNEKLQEECCLEEFSGMMYWSNTLSVTGEFICTFTLVSNKDNLFDGSIEIS